MFWFFNNWQGCVIGAIAGLLLYPLGFYHGQQEVRNAAIASALKAWERRSAIDNETQNLCPIKLCVELGGVRSYCEQQLRGMDTTTKCE